jgi:hypothetical protein
MARKRRKRERKLRTHGGFSFLATGKLPYRRQNVREYLSFIREKLIQDRAKDETELSGAELSLINIAIGKLGVLRCIEEFVRERGVMTPEGELASPLKTSYLAFANSYRRDLEALGIEKKEDDGFDVVKYARESPSIYDGKGEKADSCAQDRSGKAIENGDEETGRGEGEVAGEGD